MGGMYKDHKGLGTSSVSDRAIASRRIEAYIDTLMRDTQMRRGALELWAALGLPPRPRVVSSYKLVAVSSSIGGTAVERAVILGAARTPFAKFGGALSSLSAPELGGAAIREAIDRSGVEDGEIQHSIFGIVVQAGVGQIPSRQANFHFFFNDTATTETLNQVCASGMRSAT